jgi:predicted ATPase
VLAEALEAAREGTTQFVVVSGEAGIGKSALVERFTETLRGRDDALLMRAVCSDQLAAPEPYAPLLDALTRLCRGVGRARLRSQLRRCAPSWLAQIPALADPREHAALARRAAGVTRERMARELGDFLTSVAATRVLVVWLDDLHWADASTLAWLRGFLAREEATRLLLVATLRPDASSAASGLCDTFGLRSWCRPLALAGLDAAATAELASLRLGRAAEAPIVARLLQLTEGHPLFLSALLGDPASGGMPTAAELELAAGSGRLPERLRRFIELQVARLAPRERELLEVASVLLGTSWSSAAVAAGADRPVDEVEQALAALARRGAFVRREDDEAWPDGSSAAGFSFLHAIQRDVLHSMLTSSRRVAVHGAIARCLERAFASDTHARAAQLAHHYESAGDAARAFEFLAQAAEVANRRGSAAEGAELVRRALARLPEISAGAQRDELECGLQRALGAMLMAAHGWAAPGAEAAYGRALTLAERLGETPHRFPAYWGQWLLHWGRGDLGRAAELANALERLGTQTSDAVAQLQVHHASWATAFSCGQFTEALRHTGAGLQLCADGSLSESCWHYGNHDAEACAQAFAARALAAVGRCDEARRSCAEAIARARRVEHPFSLALALVFGAAAHQTLREPEATAERAHEACELCERHEFRLLLAWSRALEGWAHGHASGAAAALAQVESALESAQGTSTGQFRAFLLGLLAEVRAAAGHVAGGLRALDDALAWSERTGEQFQRGELLRLRAEILARAGAPKPEIADCLARSFEHAQQRGAHLLALRAAAHAAAPVPRERVKQLLQLVMQPSPSDARAARQALER